LTTREAEELKEVEAKLVGDIISCPYKL